MLTNDIEIRVRYAETDQMGYVYYGNYAAYFEVARVEMLRSIGFSYKKLEGDGVMLPVLDFSIRYIRPAYYDSLLTIKTIIKEMPGTRIVFDYEIFNEEEKKINIASTTLVFVSVKTGKPVSMPVVLEDAMKKYF